jgi:predicted O-methyltransferase YrrM
MSSLSNYLASINLTITEGHIQIYPKYVEFMSRLINRPNLNIMEIGFNAGHSSELFLKSSPNSNVTSFDIGLHNYTIYGKEYIDQNFPNRHLLIIGDSVRSVPTFSKTESKFDIIFIDGGHMYETARADLINCKSLATKDTIVIVDDTIYTKSLIRGWNEGPTRAWIEAVGEKIVYESGTIEFAPGFGCSWGVYNFD